MIFRIATLSDCPSLAELNHQLIRDEGHRNPMTILELEQRMSDWISNEYKAFICEEDDRIVAYALFQEGQNEIYLRQFFVISNLRNQGIGHHFFRFLREKVWPASKRLTVEVLVSNERAIRFWRSCGYSDYALSLEILPPVT